MIVAKWDITSKCNLRCRHCCNATMYFSGTPYNELDLPAKHAVLDNLALGGVKHLSLLGGDPLILRKQLLEVISHAKLRHMTVGLVTNGVLLTERMSRELVDVGLDRITVSLESTRAEQHDEIRGSGTFDKVVTNLRRFVAIRAEKQNPKLSINSVLCRANRPGFADIPEFCHSLEADEWTALTLNYVGNATRNLSTLMLDPREHTEVALEVAMRLASVGLGPQAIKINTQLTYPLVWEYITKKYGVPSPWPQVCCDATRSLIYIAPNGDMHLCDRVHGMDINSEIRGEKRQPTNLVCNSFVDTWMSEEYARMFKFVMDPRTYENYNPCCRCKYHSEGLCEPCPLYSLSGRAVEFSQCLEAESFLGDITGSVDWDRLPSAEQKRGGGERLGEDQPHAASNLFAASLHLAQSAGIRHFRYPNGEALVFNPRTMDTFKLNVMGNAIWESVDGQRSVEEIVAYAAELYSAASQRLAGKEADKEELIRLSGHAKNFLGLAKERGFLVCGQA